MKTRLMCPCGECFEEEDEDALVEAVTLHLRTEHPDLHYAREQILFLAT